MDTYDTTQPALIQALAYYNGSPRCNADLSQSAHAEAEALQAVARATVKEISIHPGTDKQGHPAFECRLCGQRSDRREQEIHLPSCPVSNLVKAVRWALQPAVPRHNVFVVVVLGYWGKGRTIEDAAKECSKAGGKLSANCVVRMFCGVTEAQEKEICCDSQGTVCHPHGTECHRVISPADGHRVRLGALRKKGGAK